jgi:hypothetical protein
MVEAEHHGVKNHGACSLIGYGDVEKRLMPYVT